MGRGFCGLHPQGDRTLCARKDKDKLVGHGDGALGQERLLPHGSILLREDLIYGTAIIGI